MAEKKNKKRRKLKNDLPCNINKTYLMKAGHLSNEEFKNQCQTKRITCNKSKTCYVHEGRKNLRKLRTLLQKIKPNHIGWKKGLKWNLLIGGFLETLVNFRHIREELIQTKREVDKFNKSRMDLPKYIKEIDHLLRIKPEIKY